MSFFENENTNNISKISNNKVLNEIFTNSVPTQKTTSKAIKQNYKNSLISIKNPNIIAFKNLFNKNAHLSKYDFDINDNFLIHSNKKINSGSFSTCFIGEDKNTVVKVIILRTDNHNLKDIQTEEYILQKLHGSANFPLLYNISYDENYAYFVEG